MSPFFQARAQSSAAAQGIDWRGHPDASCIGRAVRPGQPGRDNAGPGEPLPRLKIIEQTLADVPYEKFFRDQAVFGDAAEVIDRLHAIRDEFALSQIIAWFDQGSMLPRAEVERTMREFAERVMPKLASR